MMNRWIFIGLSVSAIGLASCQSEMPAKGKELATLQATCSGYGFKPGTDTYKACVFQLDQKRISENIARRKAIGDAISGFGERMQQNRYSSSPVSCTATTYGRTTYANCY